MTPVIIVGVALVLVLLESSRNASLGGLSAARGAASKTAAGARSTATGAASLTNLLGNIAKALAGGSQQKTSASGGSRSGGGSSSGGGSTQSGFGQPSNQGISTSGASLELYGEDKNGNQVFLDTSTGNLYDANGNFIGGLESTDAQLGITAFGGITNGPSIIQQTTGDGTVIQPPPIEQSAPGSGSLGDLVNSLTASAGSDNIVPGFDPSASQDAGLSGDASTTFVNPSDTGFDTSGFDTGSSDFGGS